MNMKQLFEWKQSLNIGDKVIVRCDKSYFIEKIINLKWFPFYKQNDFVKIWDRYIDVGFRYDDIIPYDVELENIINFYYKSEKERKNEDLQNSIKEHLLIKENIKEKEVDLWKNKEVSFEISEELLEISKINQKAEKDYLELSRMRN